jgi:hypothetical protein
MPVRSACAASVLATVAPGPRLYPAIPHIKTAYDPNVRRT